VVLALALYLPHQNSVSMVKLASMIAYPVSLLAAVCGLVVAVPTLRLRRNWAWITLLVSSILNSLLWLRWNAIYVTHEPPSGTFFNTLFSIVGLSTGIGVMGWSSASDDSPRRERRCEGFLRLLPIGVVLSAATAVGIEFALHSSSAELRTLVLSGASITLVLAVLRQSLLLRERDRMIELEHLATESRVNFRALFESAPDAILLMEGHVFTDCNPAALALFGVAREEIIGQPPARFSPPTQPDGSDSSARAATIIDTVLSGDPMAFEWRHLRRDGSAIECEVRLSRVVGLRGNCLQAIVRDITTRKRAEQSLRESESRFSKAFEFSPTVKAMLSLPDRRILEVNHSFVRTLGYGREELLGRDPVELGIWTFPKESNQKGSVLRGVELQARAKDGSSLTFLASSERIEMQGAPAELLVCTDISDRVRLEEQLRQAQKLEAIGLLSGGIAHDFNNILGVISGNAHVARLDLTPGHPADRSLEEILLASNRAANLVRQILAFARPQPQQARRLQLSRALEEGRRLLRATLPTTVEIQIAVEEPLPEILGDETQLQQILINLATNSWHAMEGHPGVITLSARSFSLPSPDGPAQGELPDGPYVLLSVADSGKGMDPETLERIFDPFFTTKAPGQGSGLGLSVVHGIVKGHRGAIGVRSRPGGGTTFEILLPADPATEPQPHAVGQVHPGNGERILYVDDERPLVQVATILLERLGYKVQGFTNPTAALDALSAAPSTWSVLITDLNMPGMNGLELARQVLEIRPGLPVLLSSGNLDAAPSDEARRLGIRGVIAKPHSLEELAGRVREILHSSHNA
jgi:PAS domain S-box-containing protein